jgi:hypothetical protein
VKLRDQYCRWIRLNVITKTNRKYQSEWYSSDGHGFNLGICLNSWEFLYPLKLSEGVMGRSGVKSIKQN